MKEIQLRSDGCDDDDDEREKSGYAKRSITTGSLGCAELNWMPQRRSGYRVPIPSWFQQSERVISVGRAKLERCSDVNHGPRGGIHSGWAKRDAWEIVIGSGCN